MPPYRRRKSNTDMTYHLLDEPFSTYKGLAISRNAANIMRFDESSIVVCPDSDDTWGFREARIMTIPRAGLANLRGWRFFPPRIRRLLMCHIFRSFLSRLTTADLVWCHNWPHVAAGLERSIHLKGAKLIYHCHNSLATFAGRTLFRLFTPDAMIFNSEAMRQEALKVMRYLQNTYTAYNGADETIFYPAPSGTHEGRSVPTILFAGRLVWGKGVHVLMEAMRVLKRRNVEAICKLVGSSHAGGRRDKLTAYVKSLHDHCPPNVQFEGFHSGTGIANDYREADILCCPSIEPEAFGNVNIEAMACGIPVVATRVGGIPEIAADGGVLLVEPNSAIELADALQKLIEDKSLRAAVASEGLKSFQRRFTWEIVVRQYQEIINSL